MPRHSVTYKPQNEKRWWIPVKQAGTLALCSGVTTLLATDLIPPLNTDEPFKWAAFAGLGIGTLWLVRQFEGANHPQVAARAPAHAYMHNEIWLDPLDKEEGKDSVAEGWPVDLSRLKYFCWQVGYRAAPLTLDWWTYNSSDGRVEHKIFLKREFGDLIGQMKTRNMVVKMNPNNIHSGVCMTDKGYAFCKMVVSKKAPPSMDSFEQSVNSGQIPLLRMHEDVQTQGLRG